MHDGPAAPGSKQAQIIDAAVQEFQEKGFAAASMDNICARAEVSKRTLYKYFESKENLFRSIVRALSDRIAGTLDIRHDPARNIRLQLTELAWAEGRLLTSPDVMAMSRMIIGETLRNPMLAGAVQGAIDKKSVIVGVLRAAAEHGQLEIGDPDAAADEFIGLIKTKAFWPVIFGAELVSNARMQEIVDSSVEMMMCRYGPR